MAQGNITVKNFPLGWNPAANARNGNPEGLLRMDNLQLNDEGIVSLVRGTKTVNATDFGSLVSNCYSKFIQGEKFRWVGLDDGRILRSSTDFSDAVEVMVGGNVCVYGSTLGQVLISSVGTSKRDDGVNIYDLTPQKSSAAPVIESVDQPKYDVGGYSWAASWVADGVGSVTQGADYVEVDMDAIDFIGSAKVEIDLDTLLPGAENISANDGFQCSVRIGDTQVFKKLRIVFIVGDMDNPVRYYYKEWLNDGNFNLGQNVWTTLTCNRGDFIASGRASTSPGRGGNAGNSGWRNIVGMTITFVGEGAVSDDNRVKDIWFIGGESGPLNSTYEYMQVNVHDTGAYLAKSEMSPVVKDIYVNHGYVTITPAAVDDPSVNTIWIFRRSVIPTDVTSIGDVPALDKWYKVAEVYDNEGNFSGITIEDKKSDEDALLDNIVYDTNWMATTSIIDTIWGMVTDFNSRTLYLTPKELYISDIDDPGIVDTSLTIRFSGDQTQHNFWIKKANEGLVYVGTTDDIYSISGSMVYLSDGTIDINIRSLGVDKPTIASEVDVEEGVLYYLTADGWNSLTGNDQQLISQHLNPLFQNETRHEFAPVLVLPANLARYPVVIARHRLWCAVTLTDGKSYCFIYDIKNRYWYPYFLQPLCFYTEGDGTLIAGFGGGSGNYLRELDTGTLLDETTGQYVQLRTVAMDNGQPDNRKQPFTFKITADTGNVPVSVSIAKDGSNQFYTIGNIAFDGKQEKLITIAETIGFAKSFALKLEGAGFETFKLYNYSIEYDARPTQLTYIQIPYTNLGTTSRKRFINYAFIIDTLGETCEFFPLIDGTVGASSTFQLDRKGTYIHYFDTEQTGIDIGGIICGFFEFYQVNLDEIHSEKMPVPATFLVIPQNDYGTPNRKRHSSYKFVINTRGGTVRFTPRIDGTDYAPLDFSTAEKQVVEYFFTTDTIGINIGGTLDSQESTWTPFEFYGPIIPQHLEVMPPRLKEFRIPENNYEVSARKRIRTMPMVINTNGSDVTFTPIIDNVSGTPTTLNTPNKQTAFHYFESDVFGIDFSGELIGSNPFEFYGLQKPEEVEILPVAKKFDQVMIRFDKYGTLIAARLRIISTGDTSFNFKVISETDDTIPNMTSAVGLYEVTVSITPNRDDVIEIPMKKTVGGTVFRFEIGPTTNPFHRYDLQVKVNLSGMQATPKWVTVK